MSFFPRFRSRVLVVALLCPTVAQAQMHHHMAAADTASGMEAAMPMSGMYGPYAMSREASGTAWQPEAALHQGVHLMSGAWMLMLHGFADGVYDHQGGPRGGDKTFANGMVMGMA